MITLNCTHCRATLEMDDAFAGGVCRCQHCGTIQTVPKNLKPGENGEGQAVPGRTTTKAAFQTGRYGGSGLDELGDAVTSSGLSGSGIRSGSGLLGSMSPSNVVPSDSRSLSYSTPRAGQKSRNTFFMIVLGGVGALLVIGVLAFFWFSSSPTASRPITGGIGATKGGSSGTVVEPEEVDVKIPTGPNMLWVDLKKSAGVVYVIDRGSSMGDALDKMKASTYRSVRSLGAGRKFAVVFWDRESDPADKSEQAQYPASGLATADENSISEMSKAFENVVAGGQTAPTTALQRAAALNPSDVLIITMKGDDLPDDLLATVEGTFKGKARVHALPLFNDGGAVLKQIADKTGGVYHLVTGEELKVFSGSR